jgi:adenylylsulfate kinase-like enzyme
MGYDKSKPGVIWITGLPGAGKTHLAFQLIHALQGVNNRTVHIDGDEVRKMLDLDLGYSLSERFKLASIYQRMANMLFSQGHLVIVSTVSLFHEIHSSNRALFPNYLEIYLEVNKEFLRNGPRRYLYNNQNYFDLSSGELEYPEQPDICLKLDPILERSNWLNIVLSEIDLK